MTPEQIAAKLTPTQKRALLWLPGEAPWHRQRKERRDPTDRTLRSLCGPPFGLAGMPNGGWFHVTADGLAVRRIIEREEGHG